MSLQQSTTNQPGSNFDCQDIITINNQQYTFFNLNKLSAKYNLDNLPFALKIILENLLRYHHANDNTKDLNALLNWPKRNSEDEISFVPSRVILQDFTGVPAIVDLAAMRDAIKNLGGNPTQINPLSPVELVVDHSVMVDSFGSTDSFAQNSKYEFERNIERYTFLHWGQQAFNNFRVVPPSTGIVHQVNLEYLARVVFSKIIPANQTSAASTMLYPDTVVGTDSHTTMINSLGVLGWGVGGIEAEAAMLGQPITMLIPEVVGFRLTGKLNNGVTATDLVLTVTNILRTKGVVDKFVEFFGAGLSELALADRATVANMAPEYGATCGIFPIDQETLNFLKLSGRTTEQISLVEHYAKANGLFYDQNTKEAIYSDIVELDLSSIEPCIAGPSRPQDKILLKETKAKLSTIFNKENKNTENITENANQHSIQNINQLKNGNVVIAAITSCTNTSNPGVMLTAGMLAKKAHAYGLKVKPWVKTSLAPGSKVVTQYLQQANLLAPLEQLGFNVVAYGCTTCIGNSGPLHDNIATQIKTNDLNVAAVLSGNRNFEGRIHPLVKSAFLCSPPLVVAYALAGTMNIDFANEAIGISKEGKEVFLKDLWPTQAEISTTITANVTPKMYLSSYANIFTGDSKWQNITTNSNNQYTWHNDSTYIQNPPYFVGLTKIPAPLTNINNAKVLAIFGDSVTTDHISPAGNIAIESDAGQYLIANGVKPEDFNSYGARRGNHEVMMRVTFANIRIKNKMANGKEGGFTTHYPSKKIITIFNAAMQYKAEQCPVIVLAGKEYGTGSSRDWAAKGPNLLGVKAVIAQSFERIHRSNLIGMGILPLMFTNNQNAQTLGLDGQERFNIDISSIKPGAIIHVIAIKTDGTSIAFETKTRIDTPKELEYFAHGGILHYVLRQIAGV